MSTRCLAAWLLATSLSAATIPSYRVQTIAGSDFIGDGGPAAKAILATVQGVAADALGNYYISDTDSHRIRRVSPKGIITTIAGTGKPGFSGDNGPATLAQLNLPYGLAADVTGNLYVADFGNHCVRKISPSGLITTVAGLSANTQMSGPRDIAIDTSGNLFISDFSGSRVYRLNPRGVFTAYAGSPTAILPGDNGLATLARLIRPAGLAVSLNGDLYISDTGNTSIRKVSAGIISTLPVHVASPIGLAIDYANNLYIADFGNTALLRVTNPNSNNPTVKSWPQVCREIAIDYSGNLLLANGNVVNLFNGSAATLLAGGHEDPIAGDESPALSARLYRPLGLAKDAAGNLYIADSANHRIRRVTPDGIIHAFLTGLGAPSGLAFDNSTGNLYITDSGTHAVLLFKPDGSLVTLAGGYGSGFTGDFGPAVNAKLNAPSAVALDPSTGILYVSDEGNNRIRMLTPDGNIQTLLQLQAPAGLVIDSYGRLFAAESGAGRVVQIGPNGVAAPISNAGLWTTPRGLALGPDGALYIADSAAQRITRIDVDGTVALAAGNGTQDYGGDGLAGPFASFDTPSALAVDPSTGVIYVADTGNNRIRSLTASALAAPITAPQLVSLVNTSSGQSASSVTAGELVTIVGTGVDTDNIQLNSMPVQPITTSPGQATLALPDSLDQTGTLEIQVLSNGTPQARFTPTLAPAAVGIDPASIANDDGSANSSSNPEPRGGTLTIYGTGEGRTGLVATAALDGQPMDIASFGPSPTNPNLFQLVAYVPAGYFTAGAKQLVVTVGASASQPGVTVYVR